MITCKEDLINTYIENDHGELLKSYIWACNRLGVEVRNSADWYDFRFVIVSSDCGVHFLNTTDYKPTGKQLTLSDLKQRTKVEYEKVEFEPEEIWKAFKEHQEVGYLYVNTSDGFECLLDGVFNLAMAISQGDQLYRKVERPVEWWEDAVEFIVENDDDGLSAHFDKQSGELRVNTRMKRDKWCDFARILLEQEDENKNNASS